MLPQAEQVIVARCTVGGFRTLRGRTWRTWRALQHHLDMVVHCPDDTANMDDLADCGVPYLWECEIPLSDDGF